MKRETGRYERYSVGGEEISAFMPFPLPPNDPPIVMNDELRSWHENAMDKLSQLEFAGEIIPSIEWFIYGFVRKEAVLSSQIEGTQASLIDLLSFEAEPERKLERLDVLEVCNYLEALQFARDQLRKSDGLPLSVRLLSEAHLRLLQGVRGAEKHPGEIRRSQNWIGGTRPGNALFVPPPPNLLDDGLSSFEKYIHSADDLPLLIRIGLLHVQFETLHPYLDGNGRIGRLLITLLLEHWKLLSRPLLYLSLYFKRHRDEYYRRLNNVRTEGDWEGWLLYFLEGVTIIASEAVSTSRELYNIIKTDRERVISSGNASVMSIRLFERLPQNPILTSSKVMELLDVTRPTATKALTELVNVGVLQESTGRRRDRAYNYDSYLTELRKGTDL